LKSLSYSAYTYIFVLCLGLYFRCPEDEIDSSIEVLREKLLKNSDEQHPSKLSK
jgi:hypothetical protein